MTALEALIQSVELPWQCRFDGEEIRSSRMDVYSAFHAEVIQANPIDTEGWNLADYRKFGNAKFSAWRDRIASKVQEAQRAAGIPVETVGEAIKAGRHVPEFTKETHPELYALVAEADEQMALGKVEAWISAVDDHLKRIDDNQ